MKIYRTITRYYLITNKIKDSNFPTFNEITKYLFEHDFNISQRTLQRDIENIRYEFGIDIKYDMLKKGYFINMEESFDFNFYMRFFEISMMGGSLTDAMKEGKNVKKYISFDANNDFLGIEYFNKILFAIKNQNVIKILYHRFSDYNNVSFEEIIAPIIIKEYQKRWYIVAKLIRLNEYRIYGLDRIKDIKITEEKFLENDLEKIKDKFENIIGIGFYDNKPEIIELSFTPKQGKYIKSLKWHHSQTEIINNENEYRIQLFVGKNYELEQKIMSAGDNVKVIKPKWLKDVLIERAKRFIEKNS